MYRLYRGIRRQTDGMGERDWVSFETKCLAPSVLGETVSALSNTAAYNGREYGYLVWGAGDSGSDITGTAVDIPADADGEPLQQYLEKRLEPVVQLSFEEQFVDGRWVAVLKIPAACVFPTSFAGTRYFRLGSRNERLQEDPYREADLFHILTNGYPTLENTLSQYQDLTFRELLLYGGMNGLVHSSDTLQQDLPLRTKDGKYNVLAQLLSDNARIPIRPSIFRGKTKASALFSVREFGYQCLLRSLQSMLWFADALDLLSIQEGRDLRGETPLAQNEAYREAILNAFTHNDWLSSNEPMIMVLSDRIEILSRGALPPGQTREGFFAGKTVPANPKLAETVHRLGFPCGGGVPKIVEMYGRDAFEFRQNAVVVKIPFCWTK